MSKDCKTKTFVLRIDADQMEALEKWAQDEFRSVNSQILYVLSEALKKNRRAPSSARVGGTAQNREKKNNE